MTLEPARYSRLLIGSALLALTPACSSDFGGGPDGESVDIQISDAMDVGETDQTTEAVVAAANAFLATLTNKQRAAVVYAFDDNAQRANWSNFPVSFVERGGIMRGDLNAEQNAALDALLATVLSEDGVRNARLQMAADDTLVGGDGPGADFGSEFYYVAFVGEPSTVSPWMFQFGGHHLAINATFAGAKASFSPTLTGGQPMTVELEGETVYITRQEYEAAQAFLGSLTDRQKDVAVIGDEAIQVLSGPGEFGTTIANEGISGADLTAAQKDLLLAVIEARVGQFNARDAAAKMAEVREDIDKTYFGWWGPQAELGAAYFRITGPAIIQEYSPQDMGDDPTEHAHNMYRDPKNDYGSVWITKK